MRKIEQSSSALSIDDTLIEKPHSTVNQIVTYHFDHTKGKSIKGINLLNFLLSSDLQGQTVSCPVSFRIVRKDQPYQDKTGKTKYKSAQSKNEMVLEELHRLVKLNHVQFNYVLFDVWFGAAETLRFIHHKIKKHFICPLKNQSFGGTKPERQETRKIYPRI